MKTENITYYKIFIGRNGKNEVTKDTHQVLAKNDTHLVLNSPVYQTLYVEGTEKKYHSCFPHINHIEAYKREWRGMPEYDGYGVYCYSNMDPKKTIKKMESALRALVQKDVWFSSDVLKNITEIFKTINAG